MQAISFTPLYSKHPLTVQRKDKLVMLFSLYLILNLKKKLIIPTLNIYMQKKRCVYIYHANIMQKRRAFIEAVNLYTKIVSRITNKSKGYTRKQ